MKLREFLSILADRDQEIAVLGEIAINGSDKRATDMYNDACIARNDFIASYDIFDRESALDALELLKQIKVNEVTVGRDGATLAHLYLHGATWASKAIKVTMFVEEK